VDKTKSKSETEKPDTTKDVSLNYLKEKMRERAETEVPKDNSGHASTQNSSITTKLDETKEAVEKIVEKLEELSEQVSERHDHESGEGSSTKK
jgi:hypothetical protein